MPSRCYRFAHLPSASHCYDCIRLLAAQSNEHTAALAAAAYDPIPRFKLVGNTLIAYNTHTYLPSASHCFLRTRARRLDSTGGRYLLGATFLNCSAASPNRRSMCDM